MRILCYILVVLFATTSAVGQQINPVPDYIFRNSMSVGRNAPTDTSAYFSIGPRFGATRGFMPPMVVDTAAVTGTKRNGLLIYSIQRNSFLYWDSTGSRWSRIAANLDTLLLSTRAWRQKGDDSLAARINTRTDTLLISTRAWRQKGIDSVASVRIGGSGVTGYIPKFTAARTLDSSQIFQLGGNIGIGTATPSVKLAVSGNTNFAGIGVTSVISSSNNSNVLALRGIGTSNGVYLGTLSDDAFTISQGASVTERLRIHPDGNISIANTTNSNYKFDVTGTMRATSDVYFATTSGGVSIGSTNSPSNKLDVYGSTRIINTSGGSTTSNYLNIVGATIDNNNYPGIRFTGGTLATTYPQIQLGNGGLALNIAGGLSGTATNQMNLLFTSNAPGSAFIDHKVNNTTIMRMHDNSRVTINTTTDAGYQFDVNGSMRNTTDAYFNTSSGETYIGTTSDAGAFKLQVNGVARASDGLATGAPNGGTAATWKLGIVVAGSYTAASNYLQVDVGGTLYYIGLVTPN